MRRSTEALAVTGSVALQGPLLAYLSRQPAWGTAVLTASFLVPALLLNRYSARVRGPSRPLSLALGTLGMLAGWYIDAGFRPLVGQGICLCGCADSPAGLGLITSFHWMQGLMLASCALGTLASGGASGVPAGVAGFRILISSALMLAGMAVAGWAEGRLRISDPSLGLVLSYAAMAAGMAAGATIAASLHLVPRRTPTVDSSSLALSRRTGAGATS